MCNNQFLVQKLNADGGSPSENLWPESNWTDSHTKEKTDLPGLNS